MTCVTKQSNTSSDTEVSLQKSLQVSTFEALMAVKNFASDGLDNRNGFLNACRLHLAESNSQIFQDIFVSNELNAKKNGFFVEFGATNGVSLSNTLFLEQRYGWRGILAEPARIWKNELLANRQCIIDLRCVTDKTGELINFNEAEEPEYSTLDQFSSSDYHAERRLTGKRYDVSTVSINDLLSQHGAPQDLDYLSVDTEGSEFVILSALDFDVYRPRVITVEHNHQENLRNSIFGLLTGIGYQRKFEEFSRWDDWYTLMD